MSVVRSASTIVAILFAVISIGIPGDARVFHQGRFWKNGLVPPPVSSFGEKLPEARWFTQRLDNFNPADTRTWKQVWFVFRIDGRCILT